MQSEKRKSTFIYNEYSYYLTENKDLKLEIVLSCNFIDESTYFFYINFRHNNYKTQVYRDYLVETPHNLRLVRVAVYLKQFILKKINSRLGYSIEPSQLRIKISKQFSQRFKNQMSACIRSFKWEDQQLPI